MLAFDPISSAPIGAISGGAVIDALVSMSANATASISAALIKNASASISASCSVAISGFEPDSISIPTSATFLMQSEVVKAVSISTGCNVSTIISAEYKWLDEDDILSTWTDFPDNNTSWVNSNLASTNWTEAA